MGKRRVEVSWAGGEHEQGIEEGHLGGELIGKVDVDVCNKEPNKTNGNPLASLGPIRCREMQVARGRGKRYQNYLVRD